jgi:putative DNA primase/helicase
MPSHLDFALRYAALGWPVFPLSAGGKVPDGNLAPHGFKDASRDEAVIRAWWGVSPHANIGVPTGKPSGFWVLDVDPRNGGDATIAQLMGEPGHGELATALVQSTGGGGQHYLFAYDERVKRGKLGNGLDVKKDGGYIVVEPSRTQAGYAFVDWDAHTAELALQPAPEWLVRLLVVEPAAPPGARNYTPWNADLPKLRSALEVLDPDANYADWISVGASLYHSSAGHGDALALWEQWSRRGPSFEEGLCGRKWPSFAQAPASGRATVASIFWRAKQAGWRWAVRRKPKAAEAAEGISTAEKPPAKEGVSTPPPADVAPVVNIAAAPEQSWYDMLLRSGDPPRIIDCHANVFLLLNHHPSWRGCIKLDEFSNRIRIVREPKGIAGFQVGEWGMEHDLRMMLWLAQSLRYIVKAEGTVSRGVNHVAHENRFHPVRDYLFSLRWDGVPRLDDWLTDYAGVSKTEYTALVGRYFLLNAVARILEPGCIMRQVLVLEGEQNRGKSTLLRTLGGEWFADTPFQVGDKESYILLQGKWLYEIAEFDSFSRAEATRVKAFVSSRTDTYRAPYESRARDWPRQVVFAATVNQHEYFKDPTGNTRMWPVVTGEIDVDRLHAQRDQLFAEAVVRFQQGEQRYPTPDEDRRLFVPEQEEREILDPWDQRIGRYLRGTTLAKVTMDDVLEHLGVEMSRVDNARQMASRIGVAVKRAGWVKRRAPTGQREYFWERPSAPVRAAALTPTGDGDHDHPF